MSRGRLAMLIEESFLAALAKIARWRTEGAMLVLSTDETALHLSSQTQR